MLKVAIIGTGSISDLHIKAYLQFPERCKIVAIQDIFLDKAEEKAEKHGLDVPVFTDHKELLASVDVDLVSICTPPYTHAPLAIDALNSGSNVLVEKPMASSLKECDAMLEAAERNNKTLSVVAQNRYMTPMMKLKQFLEKDMIGKIAHVQVDSFWWRGHSYYDLWWRGTWEKEGGGCTLNHAVHHIDAFQWMMGMPTEIQAMMSNTAHDNAEVEDISTAILRFDNGTLAQITSSVVHHGEEQQLIFQGEKARVSVPWKLKAHASQENGFPKGNEQLEQEIQAAYDQIPAQEYEGHAGQINNVLDALTGEQELLIDGQQGRNTLELITSIYKAASTGEKVTLPLAKDDPFYTREGILENATYFYEKKTSIEGFSQNEITTGGKYEQGDK